MRYWHVLLATIVAVFAFTFAPATAQAGNNCPECQMLPTPAQRAACQCPESPPPPTHTATAPPAASSSPPPAATGKKNPPRHTGRAPKCSEHEVIKDGQCVCAEGFEHNVCDGPCVPVCGDKQIRDAQGNCVDKGEGSCEDPCEAPHKAAAEDREAKHRSVLDAIGALGANLWLLWAIFLTVLAHLAFHLWTVFGRRPKEDEPDEPKGNRPKSGHGSAHPSKNFRHPDGSYKGRRTRQAEQKPVAGMPPLPDEEEGESEPEPAPSRLRPKRRRPVPKEVRPTPSTQKMTEVGLGPKTDGDEPPVLLEDEEED